MRIPELTDEVAVLYAAPLSGYAYKVALMLGLVGLPYTMRLVDLALPREQRPADVRAVAQFDEVPVLLIDGLAICQSNVICEYLARRQSAMQEGDESQRIKVREWLAWEAGRIGLNLAHACSARHLGQHPVAVMDWYDRRVVQDIERLAGVLEKRPFLVGETPTVADVACFAWLPYAEQLKLFAPLPEAVQRWSQRLAALPGFAPLTQIFEPDTSKELA